MSILHMDNDINTSVENSDYTDLISQIDELTEKVSRLEYENQMLKSQRETEKTDTLDMRVPAYDTSREPVWTDRHYEWKSNIDGKTYSIDISVDRNVYEYYKSLERYYFDSDGNSTDIANYINDNVNLANIEITIDKFRFLCYTNNWSEARMINEITAFVQSLPYEYDTVTTGHDEYPKYPVETLYDGAGDCEDTSFLLCAFLKELGYGCAVIQFEDHAAVGVKMEPDSHKGMYFTKDSDCYYYIETTATGYDIGDIPEEYQGREAYLIVV